MSRYIDTSYKSLAIAFVVFVVVTIIATYGFDKYDTESYKKNTTTYLVYSVLIGLVFGVISLMLYKNMYANKSIMTGPFPGRF